MHRGMVSSEINGLGSGMKSSKLLCKVMSDSAVDNFTTKIQCRSKKFQYTI